LSRWSPRPEQRLFHEPIIGGRSAATPTNPTAATAAATTTLAGGASAHAAAHATYAAAHAALPAGSCAGDGEARGQPLLQASIKGDGSGE